MANHYGPQESKPTNDRALSWLRQDRPIRTDISDVHIHPDPFAQWHHHLTFSSKHAATWEHWSAFQFPKILSFVFQFPLLMFLEVDRVKPRSRLHENKPVLVDEELFAQFGLASSSDFISDSLPNLKNWLWLRQSVVNKHLFPQ